VLGARDIRRARTAVIARLLKGGTGAEIGVWQGDFAERLLREAAPTRLHLVDPWAPAADDAWEVHPGGNLDAAAVEAVHAAVHRRFADEPRVMIHRTTSAAFFNAMPAACLDWVYIDGDHAPAAVAADLTGAWRAVRSGGVIAGDDYDWAEVQGAVDAFCAARGVAPEVIGKQFLLCRPSAKA
jgi:hypothetical protein